MINFAKRDFHDLLKPQEWTFPVPIVYGPGRLSEIGKKCADMGIKNPLIVTDNGSSDLPFIGQLKDYLVDSGMQSKIFAGISPNPIEDDISAGKRAYHTGAHDAVIAIGGGSAMDGGKCVCLTANNNFDLWDFEFEKAAPAIGENEHFPKLITIPTTAGTGAETESTAMVTHQKKGMKFCVWHPKLKPSLALLDPKLTIGLPHTLTAWTGADAMTHAIEAFLVPDFHPLCDGLALEGLNLITTWLPKAVQEPENLKARGGMLVGSCLAGVAFLKGLGMVHAISHMVGAEFDTQHGLTNAIILPVVMEFNLPGMEKKVERMAATMNLEDPSIDCFANAVKNILDAIDIPRSLSEINVPLNCSKRIARKALLDSAAATNPKQANAEQVQRLIETAILKAR
jgi:alcohol dehydrogenase class IV